MVKLEENLTSLEIDNYSSTDSRRSETGLTSVFFSTTGVTDLRIRVRREKTALKHLVFYVCDDGFLVIITDGLITRDRGATRDVHCTVVSVSRTFGSSVSKTMSTVQVKGISLLPVLLNLRGVTVWFRQVFSS